jgi:drug/metabolite transporter (DMT)-like permease
MSWLLITILAYFFLAVASLFDRYLLIGPIPQPKVYTFYVGILGLFLCFLLFPFATPLPEKIFIILGLVAGFVRILAILFLTEGIVRSEISRVVPAIGGLLPVFSFLIFLSISPLQEILNLSQITAFIFLVIGSVLISLKEISLKFFSLTNLKYPISAAFLYALTFFLTKILFLKTSFLNGFFLVVLGGGLGALCFLLFKKNREQIFSQEPTHKIKGLFVLGQIFGGLGIISQYYAIFLAKAFQVPLINALEGTRFVFLLVFVFLLALWRPELLKEEVRGKILIQKIIAILLIGIGLAILTQF